jgi:hypothetical protein
VKLSADGGNSGRKNCKRKGGGAYGWVCEVCVWQESGVRWSVLRLCVWQDLDSVAVKMFSHLIYFMERIYKRVTFDAICKDKVSIKHVIIQHKEFVPVKFDGSYYVTSYTS